MLKRARGFTIVEVLIVIIIIGILTTITAVGIIRYQATSRDAERAAKTTVIAEALEKYYDKNGEYPSCPSVTASGSNVTTTTLPGMDPQSLLVPRSASGVTNSIKCINLTGAAGEADVFAYVGDGSDACLTGDSCLKWTLKYKEESTDSIKSVQSRRNTNIATANSTSLVVSATGFTTMTTSWGVVQNALSYELQRATDANFTANLQTYSVPVATSPSKAIAGLAFNTQYFYRVRAITTDSQGQWINANATTWGLSTPSMTASTVSSTSFKATWGAIGHAASYTVQCSADGTSWGSGCSASTTASTFTFSGANQGFKYYTRVQAVNGAYTSAWSNIDDATTTIDNPGAYGLYSNNTLPNWNYLYGESTVSCPAGTTPSYDWYANGAFWVSGAQYRAVNYGLSWNTSVTIQVASRCTTSATSSGFVWANNSASMSLPIPTASVTLPGDSVMYMNGTCPKWATSHNYYYDTNGRLNATGNTTGNTYGPAGPWGNGRAHVTLSCSGPWGTYSVETISTYGPGCVPTPTVAECYQ